MSMIKAPKKLIEVALPLDDINEAAAKEKSVRHGHPSTLHLWWARRPLAAARAVIFAQMVNDPGYERNLGRGVNKEKAKLERERLFKLMRKLVALDVGSRSKVLDEALQEIKNSWRETCELNKSHPNAKELFDPERLPSFHDPFAGGGAIPFEAQRLGLDSYATDLNPVAVSINKAMIEIPPRFANRNPIGPTENADRQAQLVGEWPGCSGLAEDVCRYGDWVYRQALERIGHCYPKVTIPGGEQATVIAWIWARTVKSPNPAYAHVDVPLVSSFVLSSKTGKEAYVEPIVSGDSYEFVVKQGKPPAKAANGTKAGGGGKSFLCLLSQSPMDFKYLREQAKAGRMGQRLMAIVADGPKGKLYLSPTSLHEQAAELATPGWIPEIDLPEKALGFRVQEYGMLKWCNLFTPRQSAALDTFANLVQEARGRVLADARSKGMADGEPLEAGGNGAIAYSEAISLYLAFAVDRCADYWTSLGRWQAVNQQLSNMFGRQAISMVWDFPEANPFSEKGGSFKNLFDWTIQSIKNLSPGPGGTAFQANASTTDVSQLKVVSTDPPYYDNIGYADLSDFFYVWLRRSLRPIFPEMFSTLTVPKAEELVANPHRHGGREAAEGFFLNGMTGAMHQLSLKAHPAYPTTIYYAFKQSETTSAGTGNTGWETFLEAVIRAGLSITGTWPINTELSHRMRGIDANALASNIVLVCRKRGVEAVTVSRRDFLRELKEELAEAVEAMIGGAEGVSPVAPVDLAQAVIGPGMAIFSKYSAVLEADGSQMSVHTALTLINRMLTEGIDEFDADTQFCLGWFDEQGWSSGEFGKADVLARAKGTSVDHVRDAGVVEAGSGKVRLLKPAEYPNDWTPERDNNTPVWEAMHQLIRSLRDSGESASGGLLAGMPQRADPIRNLAYRLYTLCERKGWAEDARAYNELITSWQGIEAASHEKGHFGSQTKLDI